ncbi:MAG: hypothetical protein M3173_03455, partial [Chloroflexota bacterium]|nr:hypothetical protein [Chloroflexota bacterium]
SGISALSTIGSIVGSFLSAASPAELESAMIVGLTGGTVSKQQTRAYGPAPTDRRLSRSDGTPCG